jgi:hypothetical protein
VIPFARYVGRLTLLVIGVSAAVEAGERAGAAGFAFNVLTGLALGGFVMMLPAGRER